MTKILEDVKVDVTQMIRFESNICSACLLLRDTKLLIIFLFFFLSFSLGFIFFSFSLGVVGWCDGAG